MTSRSRAALALAVACAAFGAAFGAAAAKPLGAQARLAPPAPDSGLIGFDDEGLRIHSPDRRRQLKIRGYVTTDARMLLSDSNDASVNGIMIRRSRILFDMNFNSRVAARVLFDVGPLSGATPIADAFVDVGLPGGWWIRAGKQKTPVALERYLSSTAQMLPERSMAANLHASRDLGVLLTGTVAGGFADLSVGVFDGVPDGSGTADADVNDGKDLTYRLWLKPRRTRVGGVDQGVGFAFNGSTGIERSPAAGGTRLPTFKTPAQLIWYRYDEAGGVTAAGRHTRNGLFGYVHEGPFGAIAEAFSNSQVVAKGNVSRSVGTSGWLVGAQYSLTGEPSGPEGVVPSSQFDPDKGHWGALQFAARAASATVGREAFPTFADSTLWPRSALELGASLNWFITRSTKVQLAYEHTTFDGGAKVGNRGAERYVQLRWQFYF